MTSVRLEKVNVRIPIYDSYGLRLIKLPSFGKSRVGTDTASQQNGVIVMHALKDLDLELGDGDRVALIGHNGAGKTTLLRLIAGIYPPSTGRVAVSGEVFALLGGSVALNRDATGYENIRLMGHLFDWPRDSFDSHVRDIEEFT
jgi:ABC-type polysaccharide/polyol phosphate transport system ATPase subunit